jgi:hypothetical protein
MILRSLSLPLVIALAAGCAAEGGPSKDDARQSQGKSDTGVDLCAELGWYGDGECDTFCPQPDPDCAACPDPNGPGVIYVSHDVLECAALLFQCPEGQESFDDDCGCGCVPAGGACPDASLPEVTYVSTDPLQCAALLFECPEGQESFNDSCGCGCIADQAGGCPDPSDPKVHYIGNSATSPLICTVILFSCEDDQTLFSDECGCGCIDP